MIIFADEHHAIDLVPNRLHRTVVLDPQKSRFLDEDVLPGPQRLQRQLQMEPWGDGNDDGIDRRVVDSRIVAVVTERSTKPPAVIVGAAAIATGVPADDVAAEGPEMPAVNGSDETAAEKSNPERADYMDSIGAGGVGTAGCARNFSTVRPIFNDAVKIFPTGMNPCSL
jgi:hypothetical protein